MIAWFPVGLSVSMPRAVLVMPYFVLIALATPVALASDEVLGPGDYEFSLAHQERQRSYLLHVPPQVGDGQPLPVVINLHGGGSSAVAHRDYTGMDRYADGEGYIVVWPNGTGRPNDRQLTWNAGECCGYAHDRDVDDVGFIRSIISDVGQRIPIDGSRVYATGFSNGAMMAYRLAVDASDLVAAIAPVAGAMQVTDFTPSRPVPVLHIHSADDPQAPYEGDTATRFPFTFRSVKHQPVERALKHWAIFNKCANVAKPLRDRFGGPGTAMAEHRATLFVYPDCAEDKDVALWQLSGAGHVWPGGRPDAGKDDLGPATVIVNANVEAWTFFQRFRLDQR